MKLEFKGLIENFKGLNLDYQISGTFQVSKEKLEGKIVDERISRKEKIIKGYFIKGVDTFYLNFLMLSPNKNTGQIVYRFYSKNNSLEGTYEGICNKLPLEIEVSPLGDFQFWHNIIQNIDLGKHIYLPNTNKPSIPYGIIESRTLINLKKILD